MFQQNCASMLYAVHVVCILQQSLGVSCLTIDNRLTHAVNDCYSRISIGTKVPDVNSTLRLGVASLTECEEHCSKRGNSCVAFSFGVGTKGNTTCLIGVQVPALEYLEVHPEYDVYVKERQGSPWCDFDHFISVPRYAPLSSSREERILSGDYSREPLGPVPIENKRTTSTRSSALDCHRKTQASKKVTDLLIERIVSCENVQDCCQACNYERSFVCKGFNHRRGTDDSECTCELTSRTYFRMNVAKDFLIDPRYDYYEKTANCPASTRHADDLLNRWNYIKRYSQGDRRTLSALERVGEDIFRESTTATNHVYTRDYYSYDHLPLDHQRSNEESFDVASRPNALSWNRNWKGAGARYSALGNENIVSSRNENRDKEYLESNLGYDRPTPNKGEHLYQQLYPYDDTFDHRTNSERQQDSRASRRCSVKAVSGTRLSRGVVRKTCMAHDFGQCEHFCTRETSFSCESFAYRYRVITTNPANNCLLSDHSYRDLNFYTDLEPDRDYDSYVITSSDSDMCDVKKSTSRYPSEECFSRIRSGFTIPMVITKKSLFAENLGDCQFACTRSEEFACKCFVYKYAPAIGVRGNEDVSSNCFLTDRSPEQINPIDMPDMDDAELYERSTFPYGCDSYPPPISIPNLVTRNNGERDSRTRMDEFCYSEHHAPCKLTPHAVMFSMRTITKSECRQKCSTMRRTDAIPCMSFDYANATPADIDGTRDNCFLTDISVRDLRPNLDYVHDHDHTLYTWNDYDPRCNSNAPDGANVTPTFHEHDHSFVPASHASPLDPSAHWKTTFGDEQFHEGGPEYAPVTEEDAPLFESADNGRNELNILYSRVQPSSLGRYTVTGQPCKNGTVCQRNQIAGFWSCETENMHGGWDYCCEPNHQCGYSKGYHHPWCYVGSDENQWRPCSDTYYPYYTPKDRPSYPRSTLYSGRHWPVIYFHRTSPPNCSTNDPYRETSPTLL